MKPRNDRGWWRRLSAADKSPWLDTDLDALFTAVNDERTRSGRTHLRPRREDSAVSEAES